ncbi:MAG: NUDIX domain-containing protein [bacterium]
MIKFILHGGKSRIDCENNRLFYQAMFDFDSDEINLLVVSFAKPEGQRDFTEELNKIIKLNPNKKINFEQATEIEFIEQIKKADSIYLRGGDTDSLKQVLSQFSNFKYLLDGKIIAGSSAGFIALSKYYYDQDYDAIIDGLNILPIKTISHFGLPNQYNLDCVKELEDLDAYKAEEGLETIALKETEFVIKKVKKFHDVALIVFYNNDGQILLQDRSQNSKIGEKWGFFGGHIEDGETIEQAVIRETREELGINIDDHIFIGNRDTMNDGIVINHSIFVSPLADKAKEFNLQEGRGYKLFSVNEARSLPMVPGDEKVLDLVEQYLLNK